MDKIVQIGLLGFGTVGTGVVRVLTDNSQLIAQRAGTAITIKKILVRDLKKKRALSTAAELTTEPAAVIGDPEIDIVVELLGGEEPARTLMLEALNRGKHVVTANKDVMAKYGRELFEAAEKNNVNLLFEASVGVPSGETPFALSIAIASLPRRPMISGVTVWPGATAFTRMPNGENSEATDLVSPTTACFAAV